MQFLFHGDLHFGEVVVGQIDAFDRAGGLAANQHLVVGDELAGVLEKQVVLVAPVTPEENHPEGDDEREEVDLFHCGVWAKSVMRPGARITRQEILATQADIGAENTWGAVDGELKAGTCAFLRPCTNAREGSVFLYGGVGRVSEEGVDTFGTRGRIQIPRIQELFRYLTQPERAVEHHTALVVGTQKNIELTMKAIRDAVPYINAQAGLGRGGQALVDFYEHSQVGEL